MIIIRLYLIHKGLFLDLYESFVNFPTPKTSLRRPGRKLVPTHRNKADPLSPYNRTRRSIHKRGTCRGSTGFLPGRRLLMPLRSGCPLSAAWPIGFLICQALWVDSKGGLALHPQETFLPAGFRTSRAPAPKGPPFPALRSPEAAVAALPVPISREMAAPQRRLRFLG